MITKTYALTSPAFNGEVIFAYNQEGRIMKMEVLSQLNEKQHDFLIDHLPVTEEKLQQLVNSSSAKVREIKPNLTFNYFWDRYDNKLGNKKRSERLWNSLTNYEKMKALHFLQYYNQQLAQTGQNKKYPETYLHQKPLLNQ